MASTHSHIHSKVLIIILQVCMLQGTDEEEHDHNLDSQSSLMYSQSLVGGAIYAWAPKETHVVNSYQALSMH